MPDEPHSAKLAHDAAMAELKDFLRDVVPRLAGLDLTLQARMHASFASFAFGAAVASYMCASEEQGDYLSPLDVAKAIATEFVGGIQRSYIQG